MMTCEASTQNGGMRLPISLGAEIEVCATAPTKSITTFRKGLSEANDETVEDAAGFW